MSNTDYVKAEVASSLLPAVDALIVHAEKITDVMYHDLDQLSSMGKDTDALGKIILDYAAGIKKNAEQIRTNLDTIIDS